MRQLVKFMLLTALLPLLTFPVSAQTPTLAPALIGQITYGQRIDTVTRNTSMRAYVFNGHLGDVVLIGLSAPAFESTLSLLDSSGSELATDTGNRTDRNALVGPVSLPETGSYTIQFYVSNSYPNTVGRFALTLNKTDLIPLTYGDSVEVAFAPDSRVHYFAFQGSVGDQVTLSAVNSDSIESKLLLNEPYAYGHIGDIGVNPTITQRMLTKTGQYTLALQALTSANGVVTLTLERMPPPTISDTPLTYSYINSGAPRVVAFSGKAGETVRLTLHSANGDADTFTFTITQGAALLVHRAVENLSDITLTFVVPADGVVVVQLDQYIYTNVRYEVMLEHPAQ